MANEIVRRYNWGDVPTLRNFFYSRAPHQFLLGPFRSGKSSAVVAKIVKLAAEQNPSKSDGIRRSRWAVVRNTFRKLNDTTIPTVKYWLPETIPGNDWAETKHNYYVKSFPGIEIEFNFRALDRAEDVDNLLSLELTGAWLHEFREISKDIYEGLDGRTGQFPPKNEGGCAWDGILGDTNPPNKNSFWYNLFEVKRFEDPEVKKKVAVWKQPSGLSSKAENLPNIKADYYRKLAIGKDQLYIDVYIHGLYGYTREGKPVFESYNDNYHVSSIKLDPIPGIPIFMGWDFALNPTCVLAQHIRGQLLLLDEVIGTDMGIERMISSELLPLLTHRYRGFTFEGYGDPSGTTRSPTDESTCYDVLKKQGFRAVIPAPTNALQPRLGAVEHFLTTNVGKGEPSFLISPHLTAAREAMAGGYHFKKKPGGVDIDEWKEEPEKNGASHIADAIQELCMYARQGKVISDRSEKLSEMASRHQHVVADAVAGY